MLLGNFNTNLQFNKNNSSVEHIIPRNITDTSWLIDESEHQEWLHRLGNLILIDRRKNASLSNRGFKEKKVRYQTAIETRANTNFVFMNYDIWDIEALRNNHKRVIDILKEYYSGNNVQTIIAIKQKIELYNKN